MRNKVKGSALLKTTTDFVVLTARSPLPKMLIVFTLVLIFSFLASRFWPKNKIAETAGKEQSAITTKNEKETSNDLETRSDDIANEKVAKLLQENWIGVLIVKDNEAQTVLHRRAAVAGKYGFIDLKNDRSYTILNYFNHLNTGYGIVDDGYRNFFLLVWQSGTTKAPTINPGKIRMIGDRIETSSK